MGTRMQSVREVLAGEVDQRTLAENARTSRLLVIVGIAFANVVGTVIVVLLLGAVLPLPREAREESGPLGLNGEIAVVGLGYLVVAMGVGIAVGMRRARPVMEFFEVERTPTERDRRAVLRLPLVLLEVQAVLWGIAVVVFASVTLATSGLYAFEVAVTTTLAGIPTCAIAYLITQRLMRGGASAVLADNPPRRREVPGVRARAVLSWALGAVPIGGVVATIGFGAVIDVDRDELARAVIVLSAVGVGTALLATLFVSGSIADPLQRLRDAFGRVESGDFDVAVPVFDATEVGYASASFNRMAAGLSERERLRDLFGRQVGADVARQALADGVTLGGEEREAAVLFVDIIGSTAFAADRPPTEVVTALNAFFDVVVTATQAHGGLVNKFIGDAALCVFGVPLAAHDPAGAALAAARDMRTRLRDGPLDAGIGVSLGTVVAGNVGSAERYEYTVIGDPVNEAARLTELAKDRASRVVAAGSAVSATGPDEAGRWQHYDEVTLRGRSRSTSLAEPVE